MDTKNGIFLVDKEVGMSSRQVDNLIKKKFNLKSCGHLGTLDPFASGLLIVFVNQGSKFAQFLEGDKTYLATLKLFSETDTLDSEGVITKKVDKTNYNSEEIIAVLNSFLGESNQIPPNYSAIKINGVPAYQLMRNNENFTLKSRQITIKNIKLIAYQDDEITFSVTCSKGTYIRSLGRDIANKLQTVGHLNQLERIQNGHFFIQGAKKIDQLSEEDIISIDELGKIFASINMDENLFKKVKNGRQIYLNNVSDIVSLYYQNQIIAIYQRKDLNEYCSKKGFYYGN